MYSSHAVTVIDFEWVTKVLLELPVTTSLRNFIKQLNILNPNQINVIVSGLLWKQNVKLDLSLFLMYYAVA